MSAPVQERPATLTEVVAAQPEVPGVEPAIVALAELSPREMGRVLRRTTNGHFDAEREAGTARHNLEMFLEFGTNYGMPQVDDPVAEEGRLRAEASRTAAVVQETEINYNLARTIIPRREGSAGRNMAVGFGLGFAAGAFLLSTYILSPANTVEDPSILPGGDPFPISGMGDIPGTTITYNEREGTTTITTQTEQSKQSQVGLNPHAPHFKITDEQIKANQEMATRIVSGLTFQDGAVHIDKLTVTSTSSDETKGPGANLGLPDPRNEKLAGDQAVSGAETLKAAAAEKHIPVAAVEVKSSEKLLTSDQIARIDGEAAALGMSREALVATYNDNATALPGSTVRALDEFLAKNRTNTYEVVARIERQVPEKGFVTKVKESRFFGISGEIFAGITGVCVGLITSFPWTVWRTPRVGRRSARREVARARKAAAEASVEA